MCRHQALGRCKGGGSRPCCSVTSRGSLAGVSPEPPVISPLSPPGPLEASSHGIIDELKRHAIWQGLFLKPTTRMDFLKSAVASAIAKGPPFPYTFGDRQDLDQSIWTLYNGTKRVSELAPAPCSSQLTLAFQEDGSPCSVFTFDIAANKSRLPIAKNALRKLRTLRHPGIIRLLDAVEVRRCFDLVHMFAHTGARPKPTYI